MTPTYIIVTGTQQTRWLTACAIQAIRRTTPEPYYRVRVTDLPVPGVSDPTKQQMVRLDREIRRLPPESEDVVIMHNDAAPMLPGWLPILRQERGSSIGICFGTCRDGGGLYRVSELRARHSPFSSDRNPGDDLPNVVMWPRAKGPWLLHNCESYMYGKWLLWAHLGGGTLGHTWRIGMKLYPRMPRRLWPGFVAMAHWSMAA